jgi:hypothetical protein
MEDFVTSLVREKMDFVDTSHVDGNENELTTIRSNRVFLNLGHNRPTERVVVRAQTMHLTLSLASRVMFSYFKNGFFRGREEGYEWQSQWDSVLSGHEKKFNPNIWAAIYINGAPIFKTQASPYIDIVEKCALLTNDNYDAVPAVAEKAFKQLGREIKVKHNANVAATFNDHESIMKCGIVHRIGGQAKAINFIAEGGSAENRIVQSLATASAFLEGLNLQMAVRELRGKIRDNEITPASPEGARLRSAAARMMVLNKAIESFEEIYDVKYRPAKPEIFISD